METMTWILGLLTLLGFGIHAALFKKPLQKTHPVSANIIRNIFTVFFLLVTLLVTGFSKTIDWNVLAIAFGLALYGYLPLAFFLGAIAKGKIGIVVPISNTSGIFTILLAVVFFQESFSGIQALAILLVIAGILLASLDFKNLRQSGLLQASTGIPFAVIASALWGIQFFLFKFQVIALGAIFTAWLTETGGLIGSISHHAVSRIQFRWPERSTLFQIGLASLMVSIGALAYNFGIEVAPVSLITAFFAANPLIPVLYGKIVLHESTTRTQLTGIACSVTGVILLALL